MRMLSHVTRCKTFIQLAASGDYFQSSWRIAMRTSLNAVLWREKALVMLNSKPIVIPLCKWFGPNALRLFNQCNIYFLNSLHSIILPIPRTLHEQLLLPFSFISVLRCWPYIWLLWGGSKVRMQFESIPFSIASQHYIWCKSIFHRLPGLHKMVSEKSQWVSYSHPGSIPDILLMLWNFYFHLLNIFIKSIISSVCYVFRRSHFLRFCYADPWRLIRCCMHCINKYNF